MSSIDGDRTAPGDHPDPDLLADLAAQVLAPELSARIEDHVLGCDHCADLLAESEGLQPALRSLTAEPMPADIGQRLERALSAEYAAMLAESPATTALPAFPAAAASTPVSGTANGDTGNQRRAADAKATTGPLPTRRSLREAATGEIATDQAPKTGAIGTGSIQTSGLGTGTTPVGAGAAAGSAGSSAAPATGSTGRIRIGQGQDRPGQVSRLRRVTSSRTGARRQALEEQRSDRPSRISQLMPVFRVAAAVVLVVAVGGLGIRLVQHAGGGDSAGSASAGTAASAAAPVLTPVLTTGTNYTGDKLSTQVRSLVSRTQAEAGGTVAAASAQKVPEAASSPKAFSGVNAPAAGASDDASGNLLESSTALRACLTGIKEPDAQPVAVDLARYDDRDAAILVIPADDGSYSVWVVARNCTAANDGTIAVVTVQP